MTLHRFLPGTALVCVLIAAPATGLAQGRVPDLADTSLEDLMNIKITSVSHKEQRAGDVAAAVSVITQDDIRRSGMTKVPELLRLVPGVQVAQINSNKWAVTVRGFNNLFAEKVLVLVDGRTVYDRLNSGLFWDSLNIPLDQIDRIEVIRGSGGAVWGANAVNGVINIVTKSAADTQGAMVTLTGGTFDRAEAAVRYGGMLGRTAYRVFSQWSGHGQSRLAPDTPADDSWTSQTSGARLDWAGRRDTLLMEGGATFARLRTLFPEPSGPVPAVKPLFNPVSSTQEYQALGRWTRRRNDGASLQVQSSFDYRHNNDGPSPTQIQTDIDAQYHTLVGGRHDVVAGGGYRFVKEDVKGSFAFSITPSHVDERVLNVFAQDEISLGQRVHLTLGTKVEHDSHSGWGIQPTARVMWTLAPQRQHVWAAVSRAERTPSLADVSGRTNFTSFIGQGGLPVVVGALGSAAFTPEEFVSTEAGYRHEIGSVASVDLSVFAGRYDGLKTSEPLAPFVEMTPAPLHLFVPVQYANLLSATASGGAISARWIAARWWRVDAGYSMFHLSPHLSAASRDATAAMFDGNAPRMQGQLRSAFSLPHSTELDVMLFRTAKLRTLQVAAYTRVDVRVGMPLTPHVTLAFVGQNLFHREHAEYAGQGAIAIPTLIPRSASINVLWKP